MEETQVAKETMKNAEKERSRSHVHVSKKGNDKNYAKRVKRDCGARTSHISISYDTDNSKDEDGDVDLENCLSYTTWKRKKKDGKKPNENVFIYGRVTVEKTKA
ncbi:hypothetical protein RYX36_019571 [Vicia faba]